MFPYIFLNLTIILSDIFKNKVKNKKYLYAFIIFLMFFLQAFRGDFTSDYNSYLNRFKYYNLAFSQEGFLFLFDIKDPLDALIHIALGQFTSNPVIIHIFYTIITFMVLYHFIYKYYNKIDFFLFLFLFVNVGFYFQGFNVSRQIFATVLTLLVYDNLEKINLKHFVIYILLISLIHFSSILFLIIGIILKYLIKKKIYIRKIIYIMFGLILFLVILNYLNIFQFVFGNDFNFQGYNLNNIVMPTMIWIFINSFIYFNDYRIDIKYKYFLDLYLLFVYFGLIFSLAVRFSYVFSFFNILLISVFLNDYKYKKVKYIIYFIGFCFTYITLSGTGYDPYYFIF